MTGFEALRGSVAATRAQVQQAQDDVTALRHDIAAADALLAAARASGDAAQLVHAQQRRQSAATAHEAAARRLVEARDRLAGGIHAGIGGLPLGTVLAGVDPALPLVLLPVRVETRFDGPAASPVLKVRIYPDDLHVDDHEPSLTAREIELGQAYWTSVRSGGSEPDAWTALTTTTGPYRALWVRDQLAPTGGPDNAPTFPDVPVRAPGTSRPAMARALPDVFVVRVRAGGATLTATTTPVADALQVGIDLSAETASVSDDGQVLALADELRWMSDYDAALTAGMAVTVALPPQTTLVDDVTVTGVCVSLGADDSAATLADLVGHHHVTHGAGFVAPGTPTNNLADTSSGWSSRPDPARLDPSARPQPGATSNAAVLASATGIPVDALSALPGAADRDGAEAELMGSALFEATWGPYLRTKAQPGFPLRLLPAFRAHVVGYVRGGGPLPSVRLGRQPYGVLPVQPAGWQRAGEDDFVAWLAGYLPRIRTLWLAGAASAPSGLAMYTHEAVSTRVRVRTTNASSAQPWFDLYVPGDDNEKGVQERRLLAELGLGNVLPQVLSQLFTKGAADLWLPMSTDNDLSFLVKAPEPKQADSILGLLLRNAALQVTTGLTDELTQRATSMTVDPDLLGYAAEPTPMASVPAAAGVGVSANIDVSVTAPIALPQKLLGVGVTETGQQVQISDHLDVLSSGNIAVQADLGRYWHGDAFVSFAGTHQALAAVPSERRGRLAGEVLDCASHRYDAWVTSLATRRLTAMRADRPTGTQLGAWGVVQSVRRRDTAAVTDRADLPSDTVRDPANRGFVVAPSLRHANVAGVLRAAWIAHGGPGGDAESPFAVGLQSSRVRAALDLAEGMRLGQPLGALLGYRLERHLHDASGSNGVEVDWAVFTLRRLYPLRTTTGDNAGLAAERLVSDGWLVAQAALASRDAVVAAVLADAPDATPAALASDRTALSAALDDLVDALDALTDLGLAEAVHQLSGANYDRAAAATDMIGRAGVPPGAFDVAGTPRGGRGVEQRLVVAFSDDLSRPAGWSGTTPRASLAPEADAFVARRLGPVDGISLRLLGPDGSTVGSIPLSQTGVGALDLAADAAVRGKADSVTGSQGPAPTATLLSLARQVSGQVTAAALGQDAVLDQPFVDLLQRAAGWHDALAGRPPLRDAAFAPASSLTTDSVPTPPTDEAAVRIAAAINALQAVADNPGQWTSLAQWGIHTAGQAGADEASSRTAAAAAALAEPAAAARALFGTDAVVTGLAAVPAGVASGLGDQPGLGVSAGDAEGWLQDTARVRDAARALDEALLVDQLAGTDDLSLSAAQQPAMPYASEVTGPSARQWVGLPFPGPLGGVPAVAVVLVTEQPAAASPLRGVAVDSWVEVVPDTAGSGAVAANLSSPDSRAPNTILLAVPAVAGAAWTQEALFSVVDEALMLASTRLVDLDASKRVPAVLPAVYVSEYDDEPRSWREVVSTLQPSLSRYVGRS